MDIQEAIDNIRAVYDDYYRYQHEIIVYLRSVNEQKDFVLVESELITNKKILGDEEQLDTISGYISMLSELANSTVLYNAIIISLYGNYEKYVDDLLGGYVDYLGAENVSYSALPEGLRKKHLEKAADFLSTDGGRYLNTGLSNKDVVAQLNRCLVEDATDFLPKAFFIRHSGNVKKDELCTLFGSFGISELAGKIQRTRTYLRFINEIGVGTNEWQRIIDVLVEQRNQVAHGRAENRISYRDLVERFAPMIETVCKALLEIVESEIYKKLYERGLITEMNPIQKVWQNRIVGINVGNKHLRVNQRIIIKNKEEQYLGAVITSIERNYKQITRTVALNTDVAVKLDVDVKEGYSLFCFDE